MKKIILTIAFIASGMVASAQVGIGNEDPKVTLQVDASGTDADGVLVPRVSVDALNAKDAKYVAAQNGALVFVNDLTGTAAGKTSKVTATGFYYYDSFAVKWIAMGGKPTFRVTNQSLISNADLNNYVIYNGNSTANFDISLLTAAVNGDKITFIDNAPANSIQILLASTNLLAPGSGRSVQLAAGATLTFVFYNGLWYYLGT